MPDIPEAAIEEAAEAIRSAANMNDDGPERFEARVLAKAALEAAAPLLAEGLRRDLRDENDRILAAFGIIREFLDSLSAQAIPAEVAQDFARSVGKALRAQVVASHGAAVKTEWGVRYVRIDPGDEGS